MLSFKTGIVILGQVVRTPKGQRKVLQTLFGATPAQADIYSDAKGRFFAEPVEYQIQACLVIQQIGE